MVCVSWWPLPVGLRYCLFVILNDAAGMLLKVLFPQLTAVRVELVAATGRVLRFDAATCAGSVACPVCGQFSDRVHSRYERRLSDRGVGGREVAIRLEVRRVRCSTVDCPRRIFAEPAA